MNQEQQLAIRKSQVEEAKWRFYTTYRLQIQDCEANDQMIDAALKKRLLTTTFENLSTMWEELTPEEKAAYSRPTADNPSVVKARKPEAVPQEVVSVEAALEKFGGLPAEFTKFRILKQMSKEEYRQILRQYGKEAIENRVNGVD
jgi:hypothetical protein